MKKFLFLIMFFAATSMLISCSNGGGEPCGCEENETSIATQTVQGDTYVCDERRATGQCVHTRNCDSKSKEADGFDWKAKK